MQINGDLIISLVKKWEGWPSGGAQRVQFSNSSRQWMESETEIMYRRNNGNNCNNFSCVWMSFFSNVLTWTSKIFRRVLLRVCCIVEVFHLFQEIRPVERGKSEKSFLLFVDWVDSRRPCSAKVDPPGHCGPVEWLIFLISFGSGQLKHASLKVLTLSTEWSIPAQSDYSLPGWVRVLALPAENTEAYFSD